jgi:hypothetical protein
MGGAGVREGGGVDRSGEGERGFGVVKDVGDFAVAIEDVDGDEDDAELDAGEVEVDHLDAVGELDGEAVAGVEAAGGEVVCGAVAASVDFTKGVGTALEFEGGGVAAGL